MRVADLEGALLDYWVARADEADLGPDWNQGECVIVGGHSGHPQIEYSPSTDWAQGGPILDRERISIKQDAGGGCYAYFDHLNPTAAGDTPLIAAMRAFVKSKFGEDVPDSAD